MGGLEPSEEVGCVKVMVKASLQRAAVRLCGILWMLRKVGEMSARKEGVDIEKKESGNEVNVSETRRPICRNEMHE